MNEIYSMELQYESLIPIDRPKKTFLSVGTVTFLVGGDELPLDFNITEGSVKGNAGSIICVNAEIKDFEPEVFMDEYRELGLSPSDLNYDFFCKALSGHLSGGGIFRILLYGYPKRDLPAAYLKICRSSFSGRQRA